MLKSEAAFFRISGKWASYDLHLGDYSAPLNEAGLE